MKCPACDHELHVMEAGGVVVDVCDGGCGGIWFDHFELRKFDEPRESEGETLIEVGRNPNTVVDRSVRRLCPHCAGIVMMRHSYSPNDEVEIDECPNCGSIWLDAGELAGIRERFATDEQRSEAAKAWLDRTVTAQLERARGEDSRRQANARRIAHVLRFLCPSHWLNGKEDWAAY
ncbi:MAG TPA: zf-TFIIB domain-containing protein [Thermoguttaceae bacterium]|nr:zf-TFIIB domain-containing protein [Thermoguttaceae bacterium]